MKIIVTIILSCVTGFTFAQSDSCLNSLKQGKFVYEGHENEIIINRTKNTQTESVPGKNSKLITKIEWENDSTYVLTLKKAVNMPGCLKKGDYIRTTIKTCAADKYYCEYVSNSCGSGKSVFIRKE